MDTLSPHSNGSRHPGLLITPQQCGGCSLCELACSFAKQGYFSRSEARVRVVKREWEGRYVPIACQQCDPPPCQLVCPEEAISRDPALSAMRVDPNHCTACRRCQRACPFGAIRMDPTGQWALVCDLCDGQPECVTTCPTGALLYPAELPTLAERRETMQSLLALLREVNGWRHITMAVKR